MSYYKEQLINYLSNIDFESNKVLSVGCQDNDKRYFKSFKCKEYLTLDNNQSNNPDILQDFNEPLEIKYLNYFDDIFTFELWEYLTDPLRTLRQCNCLLKMDGNLWISAPFNYPHHNPVGDDMLRYTEWFWQKVLPEENFEIVDFTRRIFKNDKGYIESIQNDGMKASKHFDHNITGVIIKARKK
jgi:SAM-dependent methyltransferase